MLKKVKIQGNIFLFKKEVLPLLQIKIILN